MGRYLDDTVVRVEVSGTLVQVYSDQILVKTTTRRSQRPVTRLRANNPPATNFPNA